MDDACQIAACGNPAAGTVNERLQWRGELVIVHIRICREHMTAGWGEDWKPEYVFLEADNPADRKVG